MRVNWSFLLALPFYGIFVFFFFLPLVLTVVVSFWDYTDYSIIPDFILSNYTYIFEGCLNLADGPCLTLRTYASTLFFCLFTWFFTLILGFTVSFFLAFHVRSIPLQIGLFLLCTIPFWTSNVIRMVSWIPLLGRNGLFNDILLHINVIETPVDWFLYSPFSVLVAFVHLYTLFMIVPIFNSMMRIDRSLIEAAFDAGASQLQILIGVIIPLCKPGILIGSIFVITVVMGDFLTIGIMGGQQIASIGKIIQVEMAYLQLPAAAANAVILLVVTLLMIFLMTRIIDIRREL